MKLIPILFCLVFAFSFSPGYAQQRGNSDAKAAVGLPPASYRPPAFADDGRLKKVQGAASAFEQLFKAQAAARKIPGLAWGVVVDDSLAVSGATGLIHLGQERPATTRSAFRIASMTKSFTAMAILKLRDEGKLSLSDPVSRYIPEMSGLDYLTDDAPPIDIENLLTMTAGFPEDNPWGDRQLAVTDETLIGLIRDGVSFSNVPSVQFEYSNLGYALLGNIVSRVAGMPYQDYIRQNILLPLGMEHTYWEYADVPEGQLVSGYRWEDEQWKDEPILHDGAYGAMGGLITTIEDFSRYVRLHLSAWPARSGEDKGPARRSTLREMHTPQFPRLNTGGTGANGEPCPSVTGYGYGLGITRNCEDRARVSHGGALPGFGSNYIFYPEYGVGVMAFGNLTYTGPMPLKEIEALLFDSLGLEPRKLPASDILLQRQEQVVQLLQTWDAQLEAAILAENFYLDHSREHRMADIREALDKAGAIRSVGPIEPLNQLRGGFTMEAENGAVSVFFTLTPEREARVQYLEVEFQPK